MEAMMVFAAMFVLSQAQGGRATSKLPTGPEVIAKMKAAVRAGSPVSGTMVTKGPRGQQVSSDFAIMYPALMYSKMTFMGMKFETHLTKTGFYRYVPDKHVFTNASELTAGICNK